VYINIPLLVLPLTVIKNCQILHKLLKG